MYGRYLCCRYFSLFFAQFLLVSVLYVQDLTFVAYVFLPENAFPLNALFAQIFSQVYDLTHFIVNFPLFLLDSQYFEVLFEIFLFDDLNSRVHDFFEIFTPSLLFVFKFHR